MNDEIKETLEYKIDFLTKSLNKGIPTKNRRYFNDIKDYITNLQQRSVDIGEYNTLVNKYNEIYKENKSLKSQLKGTTHCYDEEEHKKLQQEKEDYKSRCEKAIEYMKQHEKDGTLWLVKSTDDLLNILQNGSDSQ